MKFIFSVTSLKGENIWI